MITSRYLLVYTQGGFERTNHLIVDVVNNSLEPYMWGDQAQDIYLALQQGTELTVENITEIINDRAYYIANTEDVDVKLKV